MPPPLHILRARLLPLLPLSSTSPTHAPFRRMPSSPQAPDLAARERFLREQNAGDLPASRKMGYKTGNRKMTAPPLPPPPPKPPPPAAAEPKSERSQPPAKPKLPHPSLPPLEPGEPDLYCYESLQTENGAAGAGAGGMGGGNGAIKSPDEWGTGPPSSRKRLRNDDDELDEGGSSQDESDEDGEVKVRAPEASSTLLGGGAAGRSPGARADSVARLPNATRTTTTRGGRASAHAAAARQPADAVLRVCPRVVQSPPLPRERSHESLAAGAAGKGARRAARPPARRLGAPSPLSQLGSPGGSSCHADSPSPMPNGHARWPPHAHRRSAAVRPGRQLFMGASEGSGTRELRRAHQPAASERERRGRRDASPRSPASDPLAAPALCKRGGA